MSYILDALKKASEQRDVHAPAMRRLFAPVPDIAEAPRWRIALVGGGAAFAGAAVVALVWMLWPATPIVLVERPEPATAAPAKPQSPTSEPPADSVRRLVQELGAEPRGPAPPAPAKPGMS